MKTYVIPTTNAEHIAKKMNSSDIIWLGKNKDGQRVFPDGERYAVVPNVNKIKGKRAVVLHSGMPNPNKGLIELEFVLSIARAAKPEKLEVFFLYFPYCMQDSVFADGETNVAKLLCDKLVKLYGVSKIYVVDGHFMGREWVNNYPIQEVQARPLLRKKIESYGKVRYVAPDAGESRRTGVRGFYKRRLNSRTVVVEATPEMIEHIKGQNICVVDDLIETGGTMMKVGSVCRTYGKKVFAAATHLVMDKNLDLLKNDFDKLYYTNTIDRKEAVDVTPVVEEAIGK